MNVEKMRPYRTAAVEAHEILDEMALYLPGQEKMLSLNAPARAIWALCDGTHTIAQISQILTQDLEAIDAPVPVDLLVDVETAVAQFHTLGFVELQRDETDAV